MVLRMTWRLDMLLTLLIAQALHNHLYECINDCAKVGIIMNEGTSDERMIRVKMIELKTKT